MANSVTIPQDIIDNVIAAVGYDEHLLRQCALVSSSFLLPSRKQLFSSIALLHDRASQRLHQFLVQNPVVRSFVRSITIIHDCDCDTSESERQLNFNSPSLLAILRLSFCCLEGFFIAPSHWVPWDWNSFSSELKDALSNIIHSSTLKTLYLQLIFNVPITLFLGIVHLTELELDSLSPNDFDGEQSSSKGVATTAPRTVIDRCVWHFREPWYEGPTEPIFLPFMCRLRFFQIDVDFHILSCLMRSLCVSLTSPATLEHLKFNIWFYGNKNDFDHSRFYERLRHADVWSHLDSIITHPTGSRLQRVDIDINYTFRHDKRYNRHDYVMEPDNDGILEAVLDGLPLLREEGILFVKANVQW